MKTRSNSLLKSMPAVRLPNYRAIGRARLGLLATCLAGMALLLMVFFSLNRIVGKDAADTTHTFGPRDQWLGCMCWVLSPPDGKCLYFMDLSLHNIGRYDLTTCRVTATVHLREWFSPMSTASFDPARGILGSSEIMSKKPNEPNRPCLAWLDSESFRVKNRLAFPARAMSACWLGDQRIAVVVYRNIPENDSSPLVVHRCGANSVRLLHELKIPEGRYFAMSIAPITEDGQVLVHATIPLEGKSERYVLLRYDAAGNRVIRRVDTSCKPSSMIVRSRSNTVCLIGGYDKEHGLEVRNARSLELLGTAPLKSKEVPALSAAVSDDGQWVAYAFDKLYVWHRPSNTTRMLWHATKNVRLVDWRVGDKLHPIVENLKEWMPGSEADGWLYFLRFAFRIMDIRFLPNDRLLAVTGDGLVRIWDTKTWELVFSDRIVDRFRFIEQAGRRID